MPIWIVLEIVPRLYLELTPLQSQTASRTVYNHTDLLVNTVDRTEFMCCHAIFLVSVKMIFNMKINVLSPCHPIQTNFFFFFSKIRLTSPRFEILCDHCMVIHLFSSIALQQIMAFSLDINPVIILGIIGSQPMRESVTHPLIGWTHTQNDSRNLFSMMTTACFGWLTVRRIICADIQKE